MKPDVHTIAYIDGANLYKGVQSLGWKLNYARFRVWLSDKYRVSRSYIFLGYIPKQKGLYTCLQESGFTLVFKDVIFDGHGKAKGNCDADLIVQAMRDSCDHIVQKAILVTSDGDYAPLLQYWLEKKQDCVVLSPASAQKCSVLLKRTGIPIAYIGDQRSILET